MKEKKSANSLGQQADLVEYFADYSTCILQNIGDKNNEHKQENHYNISNFCIGS